VIGDADLDEYLRTYTQPGAMRAGFNYYRAIHRNIAQNEAVLACGKLPMPILAIGGGAKVGRQGTTLASLKCFGANVEGGAIEDCGHWIPEEKPRELLEWMLPFPARS
jgi:pimeloyl-ACP methyl ester carboxylesterase